MDIEFDSEKREITLRERGLDFARSAEIFSDIQVTILDSRFEYGEERWITVGLLDEREVVVVWTWRGSARRIISMRYANAREITKFRPRMG